MNIDSVSQAALTIEQSFAANPPSFSQHLYAEIGAVNSKLLTAEAGLQDLAAGKQGNIHHVMLTLEDARLSFQLLTQVRNRMLEAYQDILRMQI